ncbi:hypothetical protein [uncultured Draconibacterium sp.]|uniref:hypothetical protein n=1 Tax=uncultured Draconibacterium sp. TaxID=1573823 RepID=UPI003216B39A
MKKILTYLIAIAALLVVSVNAKAQDGSSPYLNSTHVYRVTMEDGTNNSASWVIANDTGTPLATQPTFTESVVVDTAFLEITWDDSWASSATDYKIQFTEDDATCSTVKEITITIGTNEFDVSTSDPDATCNAADGAINVVGPDTTTSITFTVDMTTSSSFSPDWKFTFTLASNSGATFANVKVGGSAVTAVAGTYTSPDQNSTAGEGTVDITLDVTGGITSTEDMVLSITSATELSYNSPDKDSNDWGATQTINALPATSSITTD